MKNELKHVSCVYVKLLSFIAVVRRSVPATDTGLVTFTT